MKYQLHDNEWYVRHARRILQERAASRTSRQGRRRRDGARRDSRSDHGRHTDACVRLWALHASAARRRCDRRACSTMTDRRTSGPGRFSSRWTRRSATCRAGDRSMTPGRAGAEGRPVAGRPACHRVGAAAAARSASAPDILDGAAGARRGRGRPQPAAAVLVRRWSRSPTEDPARALQARRRRRRCRMLLPVHGPADRRDRHARGARRCSSKPLGEATDRRPAARVPRAACRRRSKGSGRCRCRRAGRPRSTTLLKSPRRRRARTRRMALAVDVRRPEGARRHCARCSPTPKADAAARQAALAALVDGRRRGTRRRCCTGCVADAGPARRGDPRRWPAFDDPKTPAVILARLRDARRRREARRRSTRSPPAPAYAKALLDAVADKKVARGRRVRPTSSGSCATSRTPTLDKQIAEVWGVVRDTPADRQGAHRRRGRRS